MYIIRALPLIDTSMNICHIYATEGFNAPYVRHDLNVFFYLFYTVVSYNTFEDY